MKISYTFYYYYYFNSNYLQLHLVEIQELNLDLKGHSQFIMNADYFGATLSHKQCFLMAIYVQYYRP